jgi:thiol-disulfide isomerase/thioredoxin
MNIIHRLKLFVPVLAAAIVLGQAQAQTAAPAVPAAKPALSPVQTELRTIVQGIQVKLKATGGKATAADLADDLKAFDDLLAKHAGEKTDDMAQVAYMKAGLYLQVFNDTNTGNALMKQVKADYKDTAFVARLEKAEVARAEAKKLQAALADGLPFPDFSEKDLAGNPLSVGALKGKVVLVDFWATWCGPCVHELPNVLATYQKHHGEGFEIIGVSLDSDRDKLDAFLKKTDGMTWAQYFDGQGWQNKLAGKYGVQSIPFTVLVGKDGKIIGTNLRGEALDPAVTAAIAAK